MIFAHRGLWDEFPENSIGAVKAALKHGFAVEIDLWATKDEVLVVHHDQNIERMTGYKHTISQLTYKELQAFKLLGTNQHIPTLLEILEIPGVINTQIALQLKDFDKTDIEELIVKTIPSELFENVFLFDISLEMCQHIKQIDARIRVGVSVGDKWYHKNFYTIEEVADSHIDVIWADEYRSLYSKDFVKRAHELSKIVYAVSPDLASLVGHPRAHKDYQLSWEDLYSWGVDGICTDKPNHLRNFLQAKVV